MTAERTSRYRRGLLSIAAAALVVAVSVPLAAGLAAGGTGNSCTPDTTSSTLPPGVAQGEQSHGSEQCCPDGSSGGWAWGGYAGQNLYWCEAPPNEPPATAEPDPEPTVAPTTAAPTTAPKKTAPAAAAKPVFTG